MTSEEMFEQYGPAIARVASSYAPPGPAREDLKQDIAVALIRALPKWRGESTFLTYLYRIAHNCGIQTIGRQPTRPFDDVVVSVATSPGPETSLSVRQQHERLAAAIRQLPLGLRLPMSLRLEGLSYEEIAHILDLSTNVVGVRLHRATRVLKQSMETTR